MPVSTLSSGKPIKQDAKRKELRALRIEEKIRNKPWLDRSIPAENREKLRRKLDPIAKIARQHQKRARKERLSSGVRIACLSRSKNKVFRKVLSYTGIELRNHLERQFTKGMSWELFASGEIHIDHIVPISSFNLSNIDEFYAAWSLTNLQPLWKIDNIRKSNKRLTLL